MAPEMLSVKQHNEQELAQLADDVEEQDILATTAGDAAGQVLISRKGPDGLMACINSPRQNQHSVDSIHPVYQHTQQYEGIPKSQLGLLGRAESPFQQQQQQQQDSHGGARRVLQQSAHLDSSTSCSPENQVLMMDGALHQSSCNSSCRVPKYNFNVNARRAGWEHPDYYDEKVDIWQVGCVIHELLCGSMPFEVGTKPLLLLLLLLLMMMMMMMIDC